MSPQLHREMFQVFTDLNYDDDTRVVVLTGAGDSFCAGQDLKQYFLEREAQPRRAQDEVREFSRLWRGDLIRLLPKPVIASINGWCFGGAFTVVTSCDIAIAAEEATFGLSEVNFGNFPGGDVTKVLTDHLQPKHALFYAMTGEPFTAREAERIGLITKVVPRSELEKETMKIANKLVEKDPLALQAVKEAWHYTRGVSPEVGRELATLISSRVKHTRGGRPGLKQFVDKKYRPGLGAYNWKEKG